MTITEFIEAAAHNKIIQLVVLAIVCDTVFGVLRAIKEKKFNSCAGIDGAIRKVGMLISLVFMLAIDVLIKINLIGFIPEQARTYLGLDTVGVAEFFALLYIAYEVVSIFKNMALCGLPVKKVWEKVREFLAKYTDELPDTDELDGDSTTGNIEEHRTQERYAKTGETTGKGVFTIVEVKAGQGASVGWGRLKSGAGWISLDYATRLA